MVDWVLDLVTLYCCMMGLRNAYDDADAIPASGFCWMDVGNERRQTRTASMEIEAGVCERFVGRKRAGGDASGTGDGAGIQPMDGSKVN
jgi:hypothetical protein